MKEPARRKEVGSRSNSMGIGSATQLEIIPTPKESGGRHAQMRVSTRETVESKELAAPESAKAGERSAPSDLPGQPLARASTLRSGKTVVHAATEKDLTS